MDPILRTMGILPMDPILLHHSSIPTLHAMALRSKTSASRMDDLAKRPKSDLIMKRNLRAWLSLILCLAVILAAMGWVTWTLLELDREDSEERQQAVLAQNARLALWRMDASVNAMVAREDTRDAWGAAGSALPKPTSGLIAGYFRIVGTTVTASPDFTVDFSTAAIREQMGLPAPEPERTGGSQEQLERDVLEAFSRARVSFFSARNFNWRGFWVGDRLILVGRPVAARAQRDSDLLVGMELKWPELRQNLVREITPILPQAVLSRAVEDHFGRRQMAALPVVLDPGPTPAFYYQPAISPTRLMLLVAWCCMLLPAVGVAILIAAAMSLNERRGAFVSAVTHELRTPLTTFRMYTEMLDEGMVSEEKKPQYLTTLRREAERLSHLVENVLTYARIERGKQKETLETVPLKAMLERIVDELTERAERAGMKLKMTPPEPHILVEADTAAVERILVNLVDNACKYAVSATDKRIHLDVSASGDMAVIEVKDHGPGIARKEERKLFKPFTKSDRDAAHSASGIGLGLALCKRLAKRMGGTLVYDGHGGDGACFVLQLRLVQQ